MAILIQFVLPIIILTIIYVRMIKREVPSIGKAQALITILIAFILQLVVWGISFSRDKDNSIKYYSIPLVIESFVYFLIQIIVFIYCGVIKKSQSFVLHSILLCFALIVLLITTFIKNYIVSIDKKGKNS